MQTVSQIPVVVAPLANAYRLHVAGDRVLVTTGSGIIFSAFFTVLDTRF